MNGKRYFLDTNAIIALLKGEKKLLEILRDSQWIGVSVISCIEYLSFPRIPESDKLLLKRLIEKVDVQDLAVSNTRLIEKITDTRKHRKLKLPDAVIIASAEINNAVLITRDKKILTARAGNAMAF
jgi:predicted nucleic acid-binding protein